MILRHGVAKLRAIEEKDCDLLLAMMNDGSVDRLVGNAHLPVSRAMQQEWMASYKNSEQTIRLMIELVNGKTIGMVILRHIDYRNGTAEIGIKTRVEDWHDRMKGDVDDAYCALMEFAFCELNLNCIYAYTMADNDSSLKFNRRVGMTEDGRVRSRVYTGGQYKDLVCFSILKDEYAAKMMGGG